MVKNINDLVQLCGGGRCPRVFLTKEGDFVIQGVKVDPIIRNQLDPLENEEAIILPKELVNELLSNKKIG